MAMMPLPVPASRTRRASRASRRACSTEDLGLGPGNERAAVHPKRPAVEVPFADQVLDRNAREALSPRGRRSGPGPRGSTSRRGSSASGGAPPRAWPRRSRASQAVASELVAAALVGGVLEELAGGHGRKQ